MIVKISDAPAQPGGKAVTLCDDDGTALPQQISVIVDQPLDDATITVQFRIDGEQIRFA